MIIVIDGPAGSGKSSTAQAVAQRCDIEYVDSGALYRTCALLYLKYDGDSGPSYIDFLQSHNITFKYSDDIFRVFIEDHEVTSVIRNAEVSECVSSVAAMPEVRKFVNNLMHSVEDQRDLIIDGRDLGAYVFPDAEYKFFMIADIDSRAKRRYKQMQDMGVDITLDEVRQNIKQRDLTDSTRNVSPLKKADDAIEIDTTFLSFNEQVQIICNTIKTI